MVRSTLLDIEVRGALRERFRPLTEIYLPAPLTFTLIGKLEAYGLFLRQMTRRAGELSKIASYLVE